MRRSHELGFDDDGRPTLITAAAPAYDVQHRQRVRKYLFIMSFRIPALILAAVAYGTWHNGLVSLAIIAVSIPLPWTAAPTNRVDSTVLSDGRRSSPPPSGPRSSNTASRDRNRNRPARKATVPNNPLSQRVLSTFSVQ